MDAPTAWIPTKHLFGLTLLLMACAGALVLMPTVFQTGLMLYAFGTGLVLLQYWLAAVLALASGLFVGVIAIARCSRKVHGLAVRVLAVIVALTPGVAVVVVALSRSSDHLEPYATLGIGRMSILALVAFTPVLWQLARQVAAPGEPSIRLWTYYPRRWLERMAMLGIILSVGAIVVAAGILVVEVVAGGDAPGSTPVAVIVMAVVLAIPCITVTTLCVGIAVSRVRRGVWARMSATIPIGAVLGGIAFVPIWAPGDIGPVSVEQLAPGTCTGIVIAVIAAIVAPRERRIVDDSPRSPTVALPLPPLGST